MQRLSRAAFINPLKLESPEEEAIFQQGESECLFVITIAASI